VVAIYTRKGDDGTTGLLFGGRVPKDSPRIELNGAVDEAQAAIGSARAEAEPGSELDELLSGLARDLYVLMAEVATAPENRGRLVGGRTLVTGEMVTGLERRIDALMGRFELPTEFVIPGQNRLSAALDVARTVVRRAERLVPTANVEGSEVGRYLNRLSDLVWALARWQEGGTHLLARDARIPAGRRPGDEPDPGPPG
jgi:cob(I)alamin adenosyltransferase